VVLSAYARKRCSQERVYYALIRIRSLANRYRFEQEQYSLGSILVGVVLTADLVDDVVAEGHVSKSSSRAGSIYPLSLKTPWIS